MKATKEEAMKKTYTTPRVADSGDVIIETRGAVEEGTDAGNLQKPIAEGSVGYNL